MLLRSLIWVMLVLALAASFLPAQPADTAYTQSGDPVVRLTLDGALHPAMLEYLKRVHGEKGIDPTVYAIDLAPR